VKKVEEEKTNKRPNNGGYFCASLELSGLCTNCGKTAVDHDYDKNGHLRCLDADFEPWRPSTH